MELHTPGKWKSYALIDSGNFQKLERFGPYVLRRPEPQAVWSPRLKPEEWEKRAHATFIQKGSSSGAWEKRPGANVPGQWQIAYEPLKLVFKLALTGFKHVGIFPEQAVNWHFIYDQCRQIRQARVLNLFAYTGGASLAARAAGAEVIHCDSIRQVLNWASTNMSLSKLEDIRWLLEDAFKFARREANRNRHYHGIILDPPAWGHGPKGEKWKLEEQINELMGYVAAILHPERRFLVFNAYSMGFSSLILGNLIHSHFGEATARKTELGELGLKEPNGRILPAGVFARFGTKG